MSEIKHTPGPWAMQKDSAFVRTADDERYAVACVYGDMGSPGEDQVAIANTRLIAAAPELLDALTALLASLQTGVPETIGYGEQTKAAFAEGWNAALNMVYERSAAARAAIAKATGA